MFKEERLLKFKVLKLLLEYTLSEYHPIKGTLYIQHDWREEALVKGNAKEKFNLNEEESQIIKGGENLKSVPG